MKKNLYLYICIGVLVVFSIGYFIVANSISYAFVNNEETIVYEQKMNDIKLASLKYMGAHEDLFLEEENVYITVNDLVEAELLEADSDGKVKDPTNPIKNLNNVKIRLSKTEEGVNVKILL